MGKDKNRRERADGKPVSSRLEALWVQEDVRDILGFLDQLAAALLVGDELQQRAKVLAAIAMWSSRASRS